MKHPSNIRHFLTSVLVCGAILPLSTHAQNKALAVADGYVVKTGVEQGLSIDAERVYILDDGKSSLRQLSSNYRGFGSSLSPDRNLVSFWGTADHNGDLPNAVTLDLVVMKTDGKVVSSIPVTNHGSKSWSPDEKYIAYSVVKPRKEMAEKSSFVEIRIVNLLSARQKQIYGGGERFKWARFDGNIYILDKGKVYRYLVGAQEVESTPYLDVDFSNDGVFYLIHHPEIPAIEIRRRSTNEDLTKPFVKSANSYLSLRYPGRTINFTSVEWADGDILRFSDDILSATFFYDVKRNEILSHISGTVLSVINGQKVAAIVKEAAGLSVKQVIIK